MISFLPPCQGIPILLTLTKTSNGSHPRIFYENRKAASAVMGDYKQFACFL